MQGLSSSLDWAHRLSLCVRSSMQGCSSMDAAYSIRWPRTQHASQTPPVPCVTPIPDQPCTLGLVHGATPWAQPGLAPNRSSVQGQSGMVATCSACPRQAPRGKATRAVCSAHPRQAPSDAAHARQALCTIFSMWGWCQRVLYMAGWSETHGQHCWLGERAPWAASNTRVLHNLNYVLLQQQLFSD